MSLPSLIKQVRDSEHWRFLGDISLLQWIVSGVAAMIAGISSIVHHASFELAFTFFLACGACTCYMGGKLRRYWSEVHARPEGAPELKRNRLRHLTPIISVTLFVVFYLTYQHIVSDDHRKPAKTATNVPVAPPQINTESPKSNSAAPQSQPPPKKIPTEPTSRGKVPTPPPIKETPKSEVSVVDNSGRMGNLYIENSHATAPLNSSVSVLNNREGGELNAKIVGSTASIVPSASTLPPVLHSGIHMSDTSHVTVKDYITCNSSAGISADDSNSAILIDSVSVNDQHFCNWQAFFQETLKHRQDIARWLNYCKPLMHLSPPQAPNKFEEERDHMIQSLVDKASDEQRFNETVVGLELHPPNFEIDIPNK